MTSRHSEQGGLLSPRDALRVVFPEEVFSREELDDLVPLSRVLSLGKGEVLITEGEPSDNRVYFIISGGLAVSIQGRFILSLKNQGDSVGEMGLISSAPRSATVRTSEASTILVIDAAPHFRGESDGDYKFRYYLSRIFNSILTEKLRHTSDRAKLYEDMFTRSKGLERERVGLEMEIARYLEQISLYSHLVNGAHDGILVVDTSGVILRGNLALDTTFGIPPNDIIGQEVATLFGLSDLGQPNWILMAQEARDKGWSGEMVLYHPEFGQIPCDCSVSSVHDAEDNLLAYSVILRDIRERRALEEKTTQQREELEQAYMQLRELDRAKSNFLNLISHELRTPLSSIIAYGELLTTEGMTEPEDQPQFIGIIHQEALKLNDMVEKVLSISKMETGQMMFNFDRLSLEELVLGQSVMLKNRAEEKGLRIEVMIESPLQPLVFDEDSIRTVVDEIVGNAIRFSDQGTIQITLTQTPEISTIQVNDQGQGLGGRDFDAVLDTFARGGEMNIGPHGLGLGLPLCYLILKAHSGSLSLKENNDGGTSVSIMLPNHLVVGDSES